MSDQHSFGKNRAHWDELVGVHVRSPFYRADGFRAGEDLLSPIEAGEIGDVRGRKLIHLQCHFGIDTLCLARRGATVVGLDFSPRAIAAARSLATETGIPARFVEGNVYDAPSLIYGRFDIVYVTWGAIMWLPDIRRWARVVAAMLGTGGFLYLLEGHPAAMALGQAGRDAPILPTYDYFPGPEPVVLHGLTSYTEDPDRLENTETHEWSHPLSAIVCGLIEAGLVIEWLHEHDAVPWRLYPCLEEGPDRLFRLPAGHPSLPLAVSIKARQPIA